MEIKKIFSYFFLWRVVVFVVAILSVPLLPLQQGFLGGGLENYLKAPYLWSFVNFDGEHYFSIAYRGYQNLTYFYFPVFPILVRNISEIIGGNYFTLALVGLMISNLSFLLGLIGLTKLMKMDFDNTLTKLTILLLLFFPASFYFGSYYTEGLFFALSVWIFYFARRSGWLLAGVLGGLLTATRIVGVAIIPALIAEAVMQRKKMGFNLLQSVIGIAMCFLGIGGYIYFVYTQTGDPLNFVKTVGIFGAQRSPELVLLPQVFYRYIFKIVPNLKYDFFPVVFATFLELFSAVLFLILCAVSFIKLRFSYAVFASLAFLIPTLAGSFSSLPRYILVLFPAFIVAAMLLLKIPHIFRAIIFVTLFIFLTVATALFTRGYWIA